MKPERPVVWKLEFSTGVAIIDDQHRVLISMLNDATGTLTDRSPIADYERIVQGLLNYVGYHFGTEESLIDRYGYDKAAEVDAAAHIAQHKAFAAKVVAVQTQLKAGQRIKKADLVTFLNDWLIHHILETDKKLGAFICNGPA